MDLKALMQKLEKINTAQIVTESVETKQVITESVVRRVVKESADPVFTSSIARGLVEDFGYELDEADANPFAPKEDPKIAAWSKLSPAQQKWMGGADPTDPIILARMRKAVPDAPAAAAPDAAYDLNKPAKMPASLMPGGAATKPTAAPAAPTGTTAQGDDAGNTTITKPDGTMQVVGPDGNVIPAGGGKETPPGGAATKPTSTTGKPPAGGAGGDAAVKATREKLTALLDKLEKTGGVTGSAPAPAPAATAPAPAAGASTKPAAPVSGAQSAGQSVGGAVRDAGAGIANFAKGAYQGVTGKANESVSFEDDKTLLAIKNIRY